MGAAEVLPLRRFPEEQPANLSKPEAEKVVRALAADSSKIVVLGHGKQRQRRHRITRPQIEACLRKGTIQEGPYLNERGQWQLNMYRHAAGEEVECVVIIVLVRTTFPKKRR